MIRDRSVIFRLTHEEYSAMEAAAGARGVSRSELIRGAVLRDLGRGPGAEMEELRARVKALESAMSLHEHLAGLPRVIEKLPARAVVENWREFNRRDPRATQRRRA